MASFPVTPSLFLRPGLVPDTHAFVSSQRKQDVDGRDEPGHDGGAAVSLFAVGHCHGKRRQIKPEHAVFTLP